MTPAFRGVTTEIGEKFTDTDLVLEMACCLAFDVPPDTDPSTVSFEFVVTDTDEVVKAVMEAVVQAVHEKYLWSRDARKPKDIRYIARDLVVDILAEKENWKRYASIFERCAKQNDREFFERLVP